jgi:hypothetical protein
MKVIIHGITYIKLSSTSPTPGKNVKSLNEKILEWKLAINEDETLSSRSGRGINRKRRATGRRISSSE